MRSAGMEEPAAATTRRFHPEGTIVTGVFWKTRYLPPEITEMQTRRQRVGLIARLACQRNQPAGREGTSAEFFDHDADLALADEYRSEHNGPMSNNKRMMRPITIAASRTASLARITVIHFSIWRR